MIPQTTIPFLSAFFLVLVGVLIGHLIWYRDRDDQQQASQRLRSRYDKLKAVVRDVQADRDSMHKQWQAVQDELTALRNELSLYEYETVQWHTERTLAAEQLAQETKARRDLQACLDDERARYQRCHRKLTSSTSKLAARDEQIGKLQIQLKQGSRSLAEMTATCDQMRRDTQRLGQHCHELQAQQQAAAVRDVKQVQQSKRLRQRLSQLESIVQDMTDELQSARDENRLLGQRLARTLAQREDALSQLAETQRAVKRADKRYADRSQQFSRLEATHRDVLHDLRLRTEQLGQVGQQLRNRTIQRDQIKQQVARSSALREELNACLDSINDLQIVRDELQASLQAERDQHRETCRRLGEVQERWSVLETQLSEVRSQRDLLQKRHDEVASELSRTTSKLRELEAASSEYQARIEIAERRSQELADQLNEGKEMAIRSRRRRFLSLESPGNESAQLSFRQLRFKQAQKGVDIAAQRGTARPDDQMGKIDDRPPVQIDDLDRIPGLDASMVPLLNKLGIYTFRQIARWGSSAIDTVDQRLGLSPEASSAEWVDHARELLRGDDRSVA